MFEATISYPAAFIAGVLSFLSPCVLPLIPAYISFITGFSLDELTGGYDSKIRTKVILSTLFYVLGFSFVFILLGASASFLGKIISQYTNIIRIVGGILVIILGIHLLGIFPIRFLYSEKRLHLSKKPIHMLGTFVIGMAFGAGWTPCIGPLLGSILILAGNQQTVWEGVSLLGIYSLGLAIPFIIISFFINYLLVFIKRASTSLKYFNTTAGILLIVIGIFLISNMLSF